MENIPEVEGGEVTPVENVTSQPAEPNTPETQEAEAVENKPEEREEAALPKGVQRRIDRLTREKYELRGRLEALERQVMPRQQAQPQPAQNMANKPQRFEYASDEDYIEAVAEHKLQQAQRQQQELHQRANQERARAQMQQEFARKAMEAAKAYPDFIEAIEEAEVQVAQHVELAIHASDKGADIAYFFAKNPDELERINALHPVKAAMEIARIEAKVTRPTKQTSSAPPPINPVGSRAAVSKDPSQMTDREFAEWRKRQIKARN